MHLLKDGGRLAMVVPAELLQVSYAAQLRQRLADSFRRITICACNEIFFAGAQQEVVLLLADEKLPKIDPENKCDISLIEANRVIELLRFDPLDQNVKTSSKFVQHDSEKWLKYFLHAAEIDFMRSLRDHPEITTLGRHGEVDVGVVTGNNEFFVLNEAQVAAYDVGKFIMPMIGRSSQLPGTMIGTREFRQMARSGKQMYLLHLSTVQPADFNPGLRRMLAEGEKKGVHCGYKCRVRDRWYAVPSVWQPDCFLFRQIYDFPRMVVNNAQATCTDTIHRFRCMTSPAKIAAHLYTHLTAASAEIEGRSYGGGVLELEPTEAEKLLFPRNFNGSLPLMDVDRLVRDGRISEVLEENDKDVLRKGLGLSSAECSMLKRIWVKMRDRRIARRRRP
jgi:adenine-specific DNA methylase